MILAPHVVNSSSLMLLRTDSIKSLSEMMKCTVPCARSVRSTPVLESCDRGANAGGSGLLTDTMMSECVPESWFVDENLVKWRDVELSA